MKYTTAQLTEVLRNNVQDAEDLLPLLDINIEDILDRFPDFIKLRESDIVGVYGDVEDEED
jgi:hypothetical protein